MPSGCAASAMNLANEVHKIDSEIQLSLTTLNASSLLPIARVVDEEPVLVRHAASPGRLDISGTQLLIGFLFGMCLVWLFVVGIVQCWLFAR